MWFLFTFISILIYAGYDVLITKFIKTSNQKAAILKSKSSSILSCFICAVIYCLITLNQGGFKAILIPIHNPLILISLLFVIISTALFCLTLRYIGLSICDSIENTNSIFVIFGFALINLFSDSFESINLLFTPLKLILVGLIVFLIVILPNVELIGSKKSGEEKKKLTIDKKNMWIGIILALVSAIFDAGETIVSSYFIDSGLISPIEYSINILFYSLIFGIIFYVQIFVTTKEIYNPFKKENLSPLIAGICLSFSTLTYFIGLADDTVKSNLLMIIYPVAPIIMSRIFLKEKYTWKQYICISLIVIITIVFLLIYSV